MSLDTFDLDEQRKVEEIKTLRSRRYVYAGGFLIILAVLLYLLAQILNILSMPVGILLWTVIIVFCLAGLVDLCERKGIPRVWGTTISFVVMFAVLALVSWVLFSPMLGLGSQFAALIEGIPDQINALRSLWDDVYSNYSYLLNDESINDWVNNALSSVGTSLSSLASTSAEGVVAVGSGVASGAMIIGFSFVVAFWALMELPNILREVKRIVPPEHQEELNLFYITCTRVMTGYIKGTLGQCLLIGLACGIGYALMGIPSAAALGVITGLLNIIPVVGPWLGGGMAGIVGVFVSPWVALAAIVYTIIVQQVVYTFISPKIMGSACDIHPALVIIALMTGSGLGYAMSGFMGSLVGMLASIPAVAILKSAFVYYFERKTGRAIVAPDGFLFKGETVEGEVNPVADATGEISVDKVRTKTARHRKS